MTSEQKRQFVDDLTKSIRWDLLNAVKNVPEDWDGIELRQWIADYTMENAVVTSWHRARARRKAYRNTVLTLNLLRS